MSDEDDKFGQLSIEDEARVALLEEEWERDGIGAIRRFAEKDPEAVKRALEEALIIGGAPEGP
jgi:hypothetical protein